MIYLLVVSIRFLHKEKIYTRTLGSAGDLTIYAFRHGTLFCARHLGAGDNLRTTPSRSQHPSYICRVGIRPTVSTAARVLFFGQHCIESEIPGRLQTEVVPVSILGITLPAPPGRPLLFVTRSDAE
jgi:hypothetical protein